MGILEALKGVDIFTNILKKILGRNEQLEQHQKELVIVLGGAARDTQIAIKKLREGTDTTFDLETKIAKQWVNAAALLKNDDRELALELYQKGQAWTNAKNWTSEDYEIAAANIALVDAYVQKVIAKNK